MVQICSHNLMQHSIRRSASKLLFPLLLCLLILPTACFFAFIVTSPPGEHNTTSSRPSWKQFLPKRVNIFHHSHPFLVNKEKGKETEISTHFSCRFPWVLTCILCTRLGVLSWGRCRSSFQSSQSTKLCHSRPRWPTKREDWLGWWSVEAKRRPEAKQNKQRHLHWHA